MSEKYEFIVDRDERIERIEKATKEILQILDSYALKSVEAELVLGIVQKKFEYLGKWDEFGLRKNKINNQ